MLSCPHSPPPLPLLFLAPIFAKEYRPSLKENIPENIILKTGTEIDAAMSDRDLIEVVNFTTPGATPFGTGWGYF